MSAATKRADAPPNIIKEFSTSDPSSVPTPVISPIVLRPVPAKGSVDVSVTIGAVGGPLVIRDMTGRMVFDGQVPALRFDLDIEGWMPGRYTVWTATGSSALIVN